MIPTPISWPRLPFKSHRQEWLESGGVVLAQIPLVDQAADPVKQNQNNGRQNATEELLMQSDERLQFLQGSPRHLALK